MQEKVAERYLPDSEKYPLTTFNLFFALQHKTAGTSSRELLALPRSVLIRYFLVKVYCYLAQYRIVHDIVHRNKSF